MHDRLEQFQLACDTYVEKIREQPDVIGILVSGSFVHGRISKNSDIDIYIVLRPECDFRERGNTWVNGVEVEYFMNPPRQIRAYYRQEVSPHTAHMFAHGKIVYRASEIVDELVREAVHLMQQLPAPLREVQIELAKYQLDDLWKDLEDSLEKDDDLAARLIRNQILNMSIDLFCKKHRIWRTKHKRLAKQLRALDPHFLELVREATHTDWPDFAGLVPLKAYIADLLGGERSREWQLRSPLAL